tara:strand:+ start:32719 stop:32820 length:102 start_codon:yes stop_codon:yes gene_type:complete
MKREEKEPKLKPVKTKKKKKTEPRPLWHKDWAK